ncbi:MAG: hypothetical protein ACLTTE_07790 [Clostridia bacterium]
MEFLGKVIDNQEVNVKKFIDTVVEEYGKDEAREVFVDDFMERLDELSKKHDYIEIFHYTADEVSYDDKNVLDFLNELDIISVSDKALQEVLRYLNLKMEFERDMLPAELIGELYDEMTVNLNPWESKISNSNDKEKDNPWAEKLTADKDNEWER